MIVLVCALIFGGPLLVVLSSILLLVPAEIVPLDTSRGVSIAALGLVTVVAIGAAGTSVLYRWCFARPPVRGAALLTGLIFGIFFLSHDSTVAFVARAVVGEKSVVSTPHIFLDLLAELGILFGIAVVCCTTIVLVVELPLRWVQGGTGILSEGTFRMLRIVVVIVTLVASREGVQVKKS
jgi:hypothetical protein